MISMEQTLWHSRKMPDIEDIKALCIKNFLKSIITNANVRLHYISF